MSEIERAIDDFKNYVEMGYGQYFRPSSESTEIALTALKEKLEREKNEPIALEELRASIGTHAWCSWNNELGIIGEFCKKPVIQFLHEWQWIEPLISDGYKFYRYEPKGEKA